MGTLIETSKLLCAFGIGMAFGLWVNMKVVRILKQCIGALVQNLELAREYLEMFQGDVSELLRAQLKHTIETAKELVKK